MSEQLRELTPQRPEDGKPAMSKAYPLAVVGLERVLRTPGLRQFSRATAMSAELTPDGKHTVSGFRPDEEVERYKASLGWTTRATGIKWGVGESYWSNADILAMSIGEKLLHLFADPEYHEDQSMGVSVLMEHTRRLTSKPDTSHESSFKPMFSGTTAIDENITPDKFGPHIDLVHGAPLIIAFAATGGGTEIHEGKMNYQERICDQNTWGEVAAPLHIIQIPDGELWYGDGRRLLHDAPSNSAPNRNHLRVFVGPSEPNRSLDM